MLHGVIGGLVDQLLYAATRISVRADWRSSAISGARTVGGGDEGDGLWAFDPVQ